MSRKNQLRAPINACNKIPIAMQTTQIPDIYFTHYKLPVPQREYKFHTTRKWRIDFAFPCIKLAIEIEGGIYKRGRHTRPIGFIKDIEKYNALTELGWVILRYPPNAIWYEQIKRVYDMLIYDFADRKF